MTIFLETKRLILKPISPSDIDDIFALRSDPNVMKYIDDGSIWTKDKVEDFVQAGKGYYEKYGLDFFSVFEKETGKFVGQAGLFHVRFNVKSPDIELAYRLHQKYWHLGYATELAKALIEYGFNKLSLPEIIAMVHPENERSRRVMEKAGMSYRGMVNYRESQWPCYVIHNNKLDFSKIKMIPASLDDYPVIQNMASYYSYDMSEYMEWAQQNDGTQSTGMDYVKYWKAENTFPFIIRYQDELVGFVIIDKDISSISNDFNIAQFFILRKFKNRGIGRHVAFQCFNKFRGNWEVFVMPGNEGAYRFWRKLIKEYTDGKFKECTRTVGRSIRNIFEFSSNITLNNGSIYHSF